MGQFRCPDDLAPGIIDERQPSGARSWINFEAQGCRRRLFHPPLEDDGERVGSVDSCLACFEQQACPSRMHRGQRLCVGIHHKDV